MVTLIENAVKLDNEVLSGVVRIQTFGIFPKKNNSGQFGSGILLVKGGEQLAFKIWDDFTMNKLSETISEYGFGVYLVVNAKGNIFNDAFNVVIESYSVADQTAFKLTDFYNSRHNINNLMVMVNEILTNRVSKKGRQLVGKILSGSTAERFVTEFAGKVMHDAEPTGLLFHTTKMLQITELVMTQHNNFHQDEDNTDLIYIGELLHDIGKILELKDGVYTKISVATHRFLGAELLFEYKGDIISAYNEMWYYNLISIITQHHGVHEERPRTIFSYLVHLIDSMETSLTILDEKLASANNNQELKIGEFRLTVEKKVDTNKNN